MSDQSVDIKELKTRLNKETAKISWQELQRFYATGSVVVVSKKLDLIEVACQFGLDNTPSVEQWLTQGDIYKPSEEQANEWFANQATHWAVVVAPWVLVQQV